MGAVMRDTHAGLRIRAADLEGAAGGYGATVNIEQAKDAAIDARGPVWYNIVRPPAALPMTFAELRTKGRLSRRFMLVLHPTICLP
jgi:hypothetical protein